MMEEQRTEHLHEGLVCPNCQTVLSASMNVTGTAGPKDGDVSLCIECAEALTFHQGSLQLLDIATLPEKLRHVVEKVKDAIVAVKKERVEAV